MNKIEVFAIGSPDSFVRTVQHNPTIAVSLLHALEECVRVMRMQERRESGEFHLSADAFAPLWNKARDEAEKLIEECRKYYQHAPCCIDRWTCQVMIDSRDECIAAQCKTIAELREKLATLEATS